MSGADNPLHAALAELCARRHSVRRFLRRRVPRRLTAAIKAIAATAPYAAGRRHWDLLVVDDPGAITALAEAVRQARQELLPAARADLREVLADYTAGFDLFAAAPVLIVPVFRATHALAAVLPRPAAGVRRLEQDNDVKSISCVAMLVLLAAESLGLGACYMTGPLIAHAALRRQLGLPRGWRVGAVIPVGFPAKREARHGA
jgi:nitroreductase